jgi:cytochrome P450
VAPRRNARYTVLAVDGPLPREMLRAVSTIRADPLTYLARTVERYGDLVAFPLPRTPALLVNTPAGARRVLVTNHRAYNKRTVQYGALSMVTGAGMLTSDGDTWRRSRRAAQPAFHHGSLDVVGRESAAVAERLRGAWLADGGLVDVDTACLQATLAVVGRTLFGGELARDGDALVRAVLAALEVVVRKARMPLPVPAWLPSPGNRALARANAALDAACARLVAARRSAPWVAAPADLLDLLLQAADGGALEPRQVRDELVTMVVAGHETVASCLTWTLHLLATHPVEQQRVHKELDAVLQGREPSLVDVARLVQTRAVVDESLRLFPPAWVLSRRAVQDDVVDGVAVPAGTLLIISPWLLHRRAGEFPEPERFDPQRFLSPGGDAGSRTQRAAYLPFGAGPRLCIGRDFALLETVLVLAGLLRSHSVTPSPGRQVDVDALVTLRPRNCLFLRLEDRLPTDGRGT